MADNSFLHFSAHLYVNTRTACNFSAVAGILMFKKLKSGFHESVLLLIMNFVITFISKWLWIHKAIITMGQTRD